MCYIWKTEMRNVFRDEGVLIFCILVPLGYPLLYSWIYNNEVVREVDTAIVDLSHSHTSREFIREYDATPDAKATYYCNSLDEAKQLVQKQAVHGILYIPSDFDTRLNRGEQAHVSVYTDMSLMLTYKAIYQSALAVASHINSGIQITQAGGFTDRDDEITTEPLALMKFLYSIPPWDMAMPSCLRYWFLSCSKPCCWASEWQQEHPEN